MADLRTRMPGKQREAKEREDGAKAQAHEVQRRAREVATSPWPERFARLGYLAKGIVYLLMGLIAGRVALGAGGSVADTKGALLAVYREPFGRSVLVVLAIGLAGYAFWCIVRAVLNPLRLTRDVEGVVRRIGYVAVGVMYGALALAAFGLVARGSAGKSTDQQTQDLTARFLALPIGVPVVVLGGMAFLCVAAALAYAAIHGDFMKSLRVGEMEEPVRGIVTWTGRIGMAAIGVVVAMIGVFLVVAALQRDPSKARGLGGALFALAQHPAGPLVLGIVALGLLAYGVFSVTEAKYARIG